MPFDLYFLALVGMIAYLLNVWKKAGRNRAEMNGIMVRTSLVFAKETAALERPHFEDAVPFRI